MKLKIVILPRGWIMVGDCEEKNNKIYMKNASVVRDWGTTNGLPELANEGPGPKTKLDGKCEMQFPMSAVICEISCNEAVWMEY